MKNKELSRFRYTGDRDTVHFELDGTEKNLWTRSWQQFTEKTQPDSYHNWIVNEKDCLIDKEIIKPVASKKHFLTFIPNCLK